MPGSVGTSFSPHRCSWFGISPQSTFRQVLELGLGLVRVSAYWDEIRREGYAGLDWLMDAARAARQPILLTVGMKAIQWPEFYIPPDIQPDLHSGGRIGSDPRFSEEVLAFVSETVGRYRDRTEIAAWQVENEPFNRSGPRRWWIDEGLVRREIDRVRALDARPIVVNAFSHFDLLVDFAGRPRRGHFDVRGLVPEREILKLLSASDVLGLDVYPAIGAQVLGRRIVRRASRDWAEAAGRWLNVAQARGNEAWIIECQAEPFESPLASLANPSSFAPEDLGAVYDRLVHAGFTTVLLWGCEYWFWRAAAGDERWLDAARRVLQSA
jgi:hypothetical protein